MPKTVLSVDDSRSIRDMVSFSLAAEGYNVIGAADGVEGLAKLNTNKVDVVICDLNMPNMNGIEMVRAMRADRRFDGIPVVMLTTEGQKERMLEANEAGATGWMVKPFEETKLLTIVAKMAG